MKMPNYNQVNTAAAKALKAVLLISAIAVGIILLIVIFKAIFIVGLFKFFAAIFSTKFGMDSSVAMFFAILSTAASYIQHFSATLAP
jgi:phosphate starvation-inducible membrane PsiE